MELKRKFERYFILPLRFLRSHLHDCRNLRQKCKVCGQSDGFCYQIEDKVWNKIVPKQYQNRVVCLKCFDALAKEKGVDYTPFISEICFAGDKASFLFKITAVNGKD